MTRQHILFNLQWRLRDVQSAVESLAHEIAKLQALESPQGTQTGEKGNENRI